MSKPMTQALMLQLSVTCLVAASHLANAQSVDERIAKLKDSRVTIEVVSKTGKGTINATFNTRSFTPENLRLLRDFECISRLVVIGCDITKGDIEALNSKACNVKILALC